MLDDSIKYPWDDGDGLAALAIGTLAAILSFLVVPAILVSGYFLRVIRRTLDGDNDVPAWNDYSALFIDGLKATLVTILYGGVLSALFGGALFIAAGGAVGDSTLTTVVGIGLAIVAFVLLLLLAVVVPAALIVMVDRGSLLAAFNIPAVLQLAFTASYLKGWLVALLIALGAGIIGPLTSPTVVGPPAISYYSLVSTARAYALGVRDAL